MTIRIRWTTIFTAVGAALLLTPVEAIAYGGPGSVVSGFGALVAVVAALGAALFGFVWFPLKRLVRKLRPVGSDGGGDGYAGDRAGESAST